MTRQPTVAADVQWIKEIFENMGLTLTVGQCELFCHPNTSIADPLLLSFTRRSINDASHVGVPLFFGPQLEDAWSMKFIATSLISC